jgi:hypothetical protein
VSDGETNLTQEYARKLLSPDGFARLLDDTVFQFNDQYRRFWRRNGVSLGRRSPEGEKDAVVVPAMFDKASRTFNWIAIADSVLGPDYGADNKLATEERQNALQSVIEALHANFFQMPEDSSNWIKFCERFSDSAHCENAVEILTRELDKYSGLPEAKRSKYFSSLMSPENSAHLFLIYHSVSLLYSSYSHPVDQYFEGIFYKILERFGHDSPGIVEQAVFGRLGSDSMCGGAALPETWLDLRAWKSVRGATDYEHDGHDGNAQTTIQDTYYSPRRKAETKIAEEAFLNPLLMDRKFAAGEDVTFGQSFQLHRYLLLVPLYDVWVGSSGFGGLQAVLLIFLKPPELGESCGLIGHKGWEGKYIDMLQRSEQFAREVAATSIRRAIATPIKPPYDLVRHFLSILIEVQDWDEAVVFYEGKANYHFIRKSKQRGNKHQWQGVRTEWNVDESGENNANIKGPCDQSGGMVKHSSDCGTDFYMWWTCEAGGIAGGKRPHYNLWSTYFLSDLTPDERAAFQGTSIRFKFPKACRIPEDDASRDYLVESYLRQQLELMRVLAPKVRARRAALRNAVSAIMGRNMSHNIGSHVLARYANKIRTHKPGGEEYPDPRTDFMSYLQRRMDFLAEVATADQSFWLQPLMLKDQVNRLNYEAQMKRFYGERCKAEAGKNYPPLLTYITGKEDLGANVEFMPNEDENESGQLLFSCPGGEVGMHALYVILENVIRNSARHNGEKTSGDGGMVEIEVRARASISEEKDRERFPPKDWGGLIELRILDKRTELGPDGAPLSLTKQGSASWKWNDKLTDTKDEYGKRVKFAALPDEINWVIQYEPILNDDGSPNPNFWGIREIQICAQYLRQLLLSDLEDVPFADHDSAASKVPLIRAECEEYERDKYCLSYVIYVREAKLLAVIEAASDPEKAQAPLEQKPGFARLELSKASLDQRGKPEAGSVLARALDELRNYAFVAHDKIVASWVKARRGDLPVRCLALPSDVCGEGSLTLHAAQALFDNGNEPLDGMEELYEAYTHGIHPPQESRVLAGLAFDGGNLGLAASNLPSNGQPKFPISATKKWANDDIKADWFNHLFQDRINKVEGCYWLDHVSSENKGKLTRFVIERGAEGDHELIAWEPCFYGSPALETLNRLKPGQGWELMAASLPRVVVLDERVQSHATQPYRDIAFKEFWQGMRVDVPEKSKCDLDTPRFNACRVYLGNLNHEADYLVIHLTILERLQRERGDKPLLDMIEELTACTNVKADAEIMVVTGRGVPTFARATLLNQQDKGNHDLAGRLRYLPVSALLEYLITRPSKLGLMRVLWSASQPGRRAE